MNDFDKKAIDLINDFCEKEYGEGIKYNDPSRIDIMFTEYEVEDTDLEDTLSVQVSVDLTMGRITLEYNDILVYAETYGRTDKFLEQLDYLDFMAWTSLDELDTYKEKLAKIEELNRQMNNSDDNRQQDCLREQIEKVKKEMVENDKI